MSVPRTTVDPVPDPSSYRPAPGTIPEAPGVYRFRDPTGRVIYVGKAKNLRNRLNSYFADTWSLHARTQQMVTTAAAVDWVTVGTEVEALQLEFSWIKEFDPRFNVKYRDDKSYPFLAVTLNEEYPRLQVMRGAKRKGVRYFGPYSHAWAIRETLDLLLRVFPARTCSAGVFKRAAQIGRPCLLGYIGKCSAPCVGTVSADEHRAIVDDFCDFMAGRTDAFVKRLERDMLQASEELEFEQAARLRDDIAALRRAMEKQTVVLGDGTDADVVAFAEDPLEAAVQVFHVRDGRVRGQRGWVVEKVEDLTTGDLVHHFCTQVYGEEHGEGDVPRELLVPELPADATALADWLSEHRGSRVSLRVPQRGDKRSLMETVARNAGEALHRHKLRRAGDLTTRSKALDEIAEALGWNGAAAHRVLRRVADPGHRRGGAHGGLRGRAGAQERVPAVRRPRQPGRQRHRRPGRDERGDAAAVRPVQGAGRRRRPARHPGARRRPTARRARVAGDGAEPATAELPGIDPLTGRPRRFAYPPQLVVVDGGQPQVNAVAAVLSELGITDVALCGLAKRLEEVWLPGEDFPVILPRTSEALYLLQRVRDEAHRFAITFHRQRRSKRMTASGAGQCARPGRDPAQGAAAPFRLVQAARRGDPRGDRRGARHRPAHRRGGAGRAEPDARTTPPTGGRREGAARATATADTGRRAASPGGAGTAAVSA